MPELPEVETVRKALEKAAINKKIVDISADFRLKNYIFEIINYNSPLVFFPNRLNYTINYIYYYPL